MAHVCTSCDQFIVGITNFLMIICPILLQKLDPPFLVGSTGSHEHESFYRRFILWEMSARRKSSSAYSRNFIGLFLILPLSPLHLQLYQSHWYQLMSSCESISSSLCNPLLFHWQGYSIFFLLLLWQSLSFLILPFRFLQSSFSFPSLPTLFLKLCHNRSIRR